jgi:hypothetical protein
VELTWDGGRMDLDVPSGDPETGEVVRLLRGSRLISDWESRYPSEEAAAPLEKRQQSRVAARLLELSKMYGLASREMSLVAVVKRQGDRPGELPDTRVVPVGMPQDTAFQAYFGGAAKQIDAAAYIASRFSASILSAAPRKAAPAWGSPGPLYSLRSGTSTADVTAGNADLVDLARMLEPDGGMPGDSPGVRAGRTIAAVFAFVAEGHTLTMGAFRLHVIRLAVFLKSLSVASDREARLIVGAFDAASTGKVPAGQWLVLAREPGTGWKQIEEALK